MKCEQMARVLFYIRLIIDLDQFLIKEMISSRLIISLIEI